MAILVIAEHDNKQLKTGVANTIAAAAKLGGDISVLVAGSGCAEAAAAAAKIDGVKKENAPTTADRQALRRAPCRSVVHAVRSV